MLNQQNTQKIIKLQKENGIFIFFGDYPNEEDFLAFLDFLKDKLSVSLSESNQYIYMLSVELNIENKKVTAMSGSDFGCFLSLELGLDNFADEIIKKCSI